MKRIGEYAFAGCSWLRTIQLPIGLTRIEDRTFSNCISLEKINIPDTVTSIGESAFYDCSALTEVLIPKDVTHIEKYAFSDCQLLNGVILPVAVSYIGKQAFSSTVSMTELAIQNGNARVYDNIVYDFYNRQKVIITAPANGAVQRMAARIKIPFKALKQVAN